MWELIRIKYFIQMHVHLNLSLWNVSPHRIVMCNIQARGKSCSRRGGRFTSPTGANTHIQLFLCARGSVFVSGVGRRNSGIIGTN
jgi:hypothetical protein